MKSTVEHLSPTRVKLAVEVPFDELKPNFDRAYKRIAGQVRIPGFRPGKVPARILEQRLGRGVVIEEVVNEAVPAKYGEALAEAEVEPLGQPDVEITSNVAELGESEPLSFTAEVDVRPEITLPEYTDISVSVDAAEVSDQDIDDQLQSLRTRFGTLTGVDRPAENGDFVVMDLSAEVDGEEIEDAKTTGMSHEVGSGQLVDGVDEALVGMSAGDEKTFTTKLFAGEHADRDADVHVTVSQVKERKLPEADDEFAQLASEFDTLDELRTDMRERLARVKRMEQGGDARDKVLEEVLERAAVPLPEVVVQSEVDNRLHQALHQFEHDEDAFGQYLETQGQTREEFDTESRAEAEKTVATQLLLDKVAEIEAVEVGQQELMERIYMQAQRLQMSPEEFIQQAQQANQLQAIFSDVRRGKALAAIVQAATILGPDGEELDLSDLFYTERADDAAPAESEDAPDAEGADTAAGPTGADGDATQVPQGDSEAAGPEADAVGSPNTGADTETVSESRA